MLLTTILSSLTKKIHGNNVQMNFFTKLLTTDSGLSSKSFFLVVTTLCGIVLLAVPAVVLLVEVYYNHTITTDLSGLASYIAAVAALFGTAGITKAWSDWSENKYIKSGDDEDTEDEQS